MMDKNDIDPNPPAEDGTIRCSLKKRAMADGAHETEFKKQKLEQLQRKAYHSLLLASKSETSSETSSHEKNATCRPNSVPKPSSSWSSVNPESLVRARSPNQDDLPTNKKMKQAHDDVLHVFNAESPALSHSTTLSMQDLLEECNKAHIKKIVEPRSRLLPEDLYFRPTALEMANYLKQKVLGQPIEACIIPEERHDIFTIPPRDLPGYPEETHWYYYCMKPKGQDTQSLWTRFRENTAVFDEEENCVGIKRRFTIIEREEETNDIFLADEEEPPVEEWFIKEISLPSSVADTDLVLCHVVLKKREKTKEEEEYYDEEEDEEEEEEDE